MVDQAIRHGARMPLLAPCPWIPASAGMTEGEKDGRSSDPSWYSTGSTVAPLTPALSQGERKRQGTKRWGQAADRAWPSQGTQGANQ